MRQLLFFLAVAVACVSARQPGFRVRFGNGQEIGTEVFIDLPRTLSSALVQRWVWTEKADRSPSALDLYCRTDRLLCVFFDDTGYVAGLQIAFPEDQFENVFDWTIQGYGKWTPPVINGETKTYWALQQYYISEEALQKSPAERIATRDNSRLLQFGGVWVTSFNGELTRMSTQTSEYVNSIYKLQACIDGMGRHFYYNMSSETLCESGKMGSWFPMVHSGELVATGFLGYGKLTLLEGQREWFEINDRTGIETVITDGPECFFEMVDSPGTLSLHIYYVEEPWLLDCIQQ